jgi:hypothetical protein
MSPDAEAMSPDAGAMSPDAEAAGSVGVRYTLSSWEQPLSNITYSLTNGASSYEGVVHVGTQASIQFVISDVVAGAGYTIALAGTGDDGCGSCSGAVGMGIPDSGLNEGIDTGAPFAVTALETTWVDVNVDCSKALSCGQRPNNCCAIWDTIGATPTSLSTIPNVGPGNTALLIGHAVGPCDSYADSGVNLDCTWTVLSGTGQVSATRNFGGTFTAQFTCPQDDESDTLQFDCTDGPLPEGGACPASLTTGTTDVLCQTPAPDASANDASADARSPDSG